MPVQAVSRLRSNPPAAPRLRAVTPEPNAEPTGTLPAEVAAIVSKLAGCKRRVRQGEFLYRSGAEFPCL
jgi:hypothetical protein